MRDIPTRTNVAEPPPIPDDLCDVLRCVDTAAEAAMWDVLTLDLDWPLSLQYVAVIA